MICNRFFFWIVFLFVGVATSLAQSDNLLEIKKANLLKGAEGFERLLGDVFMKHQSSLIYCDSAHFFRDSNRAQLFGNVRIVDEMDPVTTTSRYAEYNGNTKIAKLREDVVFKNEETTLYTDFLDYNRTTNIANYFNEGRVVDSVNVLTSLRGRYEVGLERITFQSDVVLVNPDYTMKTDFLIYLTVPKTAETKGLTNLVSSEGNTLDAEKGSFYDTQNKQFRFFNGTVETETSRVKAKELFYDELKMYYEGKEDVRFFNKEREVEVFGDMGQYYEERSYSLVYGKALVRKYFEKDTLFMISDSLISYDSEEDSSSYLLAFRGVKLVKSGLSGISDSLVYNYSDSSIRLFDDPVLWNEKSQISSEKMEFYLVNEVLDRAYMETDAFSIIQDTLLNFNQMKGRKMTAYFSDGNIDKLHIEGNGESLYYALEADTLTQGINRTLSSTVTLTFDEGAIDRVAYTIRPDGRFIPVQEVDSENSRLEGFAWRVKERPSKAVIDLWRKPEEINPNALNLFDLPEEEVRMPNEDEIQKMIENKLKTEGEKRDPNKIYRLKKKNNE